MYRSEVRIPVKRDNLSFQQRQRSLFDDMSFDMDRQRREWDEEMQRMRDNFFSLKPFETGSLLSSSPRLGRRNESPTPREVTSGFSTDGKVHTFRVRFDVAGFNPEEIKVSTDDTKVTVYALHKEEHGNSTVSNEFRRQVDIPSNVKPDDIQCLLSTDGVLTLEAPVHAPAYQAIQSEPQKPPSTVGEERYQSNGSVHRSPLPTDYTTSSVAQSLRASPMTSSVSQYREERSTPPRASPRLQRPSYASPLASALGSGIGRAGIAIVEESGERKMRVKIPAFDFRPDELRIKTVDKRLHVEAQHEERTDTGSVSKQFSRDYDLPEYVNPNDVTAYIDDEGALVIEAPIRAQCSSPRPQVTVQVAHH